MNKLINWFLKEPNRTFKIMELDDILFGNEINNILIINSDFFVDNIKSLKTKYVICYDIEQNIYDKNKSILEKLNIEHTYIGKVKLNYTNEIDLIIYESIYSDIINDLKIKIKLKLEKNLNV